MNSEFHRIKRLPPYVFAEVNATKAKMRASGADINACIAPLARAQHERRARASLQAAATKVDFFTMVRGDG